MLFIIRGRTIFSCNSKCYRWRYYDFDEVVCVVMTGMGADGMEGIAHLKEKKKTFVITQDENSCVVYGMPKSVVKAGLSDETIPLPLIAQEIILHVGVK